VHGERHAIEHVAVGEDVGAADVHFAAERLGHLGRAQQVLDDVVDGDRLGGGAQPAGGDHDGQSFDEVAQRAVGLAGGADDHGGAEVCERRPVGGERERGFVAAAQVLGDAVVAEPAEVRGAVNAFALGGGGEVGRAEALALLEACAAGHGVHEEVRDVDPLADAVKAARVGHVAAADLTACALEMRGARWVADQAPNVGTAREQRIGEAAADEPGRSGYERVCCDPLRLPLRCSATSGPVVVVMTAAPLPPSARRTRPGARMRTAAARA
jgi:hypothetical protein